MSYSLAIADGDLVQQGSRLGVVFGMDKLRQDLRCWLMERYGIDRFHTNTGSNLQAFIGSIVKETTRVEVQSEVFRILQNYQLTQAKRYQENPEKFSFSELLIEVKSIITSVDYDTVRVAITFRNGDEESSTIRVLTKN